MGDCTGLSSCLTYCLGECDSSGVEFSYHCLLVWCGTDNIGEQHIKKKLIVDRHKNTFHEIIIISNYANKIP